MRVGYVRVSSVEQNEERQIVELKQKADVEKFFVDKISMNILGATVSYKNGTLTFSVGNASLILNFIGSSADLIADNNFIGNDVQLDEITPITFEQGDYQNAYELGNSQDTLSGSTDITFTGA